jgi:hypothetical protein
MELAILRQNLQDISSPQFPLSLLQVCRVVGMGTPGGTSGNYQRRARSISLYGCSTSGGTSHRGPVVEEETRKHRSFSANIHGDRSRLCLCCNSLRFQIWQLTVNNRLLACSFSNVSSACQRNEPPVGKPTLLIL